jgi:solute carrier family 13 (sodium-dependent dicarboxylate transporter), member 2/3/5
MKATLINYGRSFRKLVVPKYSASVKYALLYHVRYRPLQPSYIMISRGRASQMGLFLGPLLFLGLLFLPMDILNDLSFEARIVLATTIWMGTWWITEAIPIYITALLPLVIFPSLYITDLGQTSSNYADRVVFLFLGGFILAKAVEKSNLHMRFALNILKIFGSNPKHIVAAFMAVTGILSAWMSNTATAMLMIPIASAVIAQFRDEKHQKKFAVCIMLSIAYSASIGGMATLIGTPPNAIFASLSQSLLDIDISFGQWLLIGVPISGISLVIAWLYMIRFGSKVTDITSIIEERGMIYERLTKLGPFTRDEKIVAAIFISTAIAWITRGLLWKDFLPMVDDSTIVLAAAIALFLIPSSSVLSSQGHTMNSKKINLTKDEGRVRNEDTRYKANIMNSSANLSRNEDGRKKLLDWNTAVKIPWGVLLLIGGGLALANAFTATGLDKWIASQLNFLAGMPFIIVILVVVAIAILSSEIISNTATAALLIPIAASLSVVLEVNPLLLMVPITIATSYGFIMPVGTPPNAIVFASGHVTARKMARAGLPLDIIGIAIVTLFATTLVPMLLE